MLELITFAQARLFRDIVDRKSVSRAAQENGISQSAASQHLNELEKRLGAELLDRSKRPFALMPTGRLYYELCRDVVRRGEGFEASLTQLKAEIGGTVRVACIYSVLPELSSLEKEFLKRLPKGRITLTFLHPEEIYEAVLSGRADLGIVSFPAHRRYLSAIPWREELMQVAAPVDHPLASAGTLAPSKLERQAFVAFDEDIPIRREIDRYLREHDVDVDVVLQFDSIQMVKEAVELGRGISILPFPAIWPEVTRGRLAAIPLAVPLYRPLAILHDKRKELSAAVREFVGMMHEFVDGSQNEAIRRPQTEAVVSGG